MDSQEFNLKRTAINGTKWTGLSTGIMSILQLLQMIILARLLRPDDFGLMGMLTVILGFAGAFSDVGVSNAIISRQDTNKMQLSSLFFLTQVSGILITAILFIISPLISALYNQPALSEYIPIIVWIIPITCLGQQFQMLLQKNFSFRYLSLIDIISTTLALIITIGSALLNFGVYSLIFGQLTSSVVKTCFFLLGGLREWPVLPHFNIKDLKGYLNFGFYQVGERVVIFLNSNLDFILIGAILGSKELGYYTFAYNLILLPVNKINPIITKVAFPILSRVQNDIEALKNSYLKMLSILSFINVPILFGLAAVAPNAIIIIFGGQWSPSILLIQILSLLGVLRCFCNPIGTLMLAKGRADLGFKWNLILLVPQVIGLYSGLYLGGTLGVAIAFTLLMLANTILIYVFPIKILVGRCAKDYFSSIWLPVRYSAIMFLVVFLIHFISGESMDIKVLILQILSGVIIYSMLFFVFERIKFAELIKLLKKS